MYGLIAAGLDEMHSCADKLQTGNNTPHSCKNFKPLNMSVQMRNSFGVLFPNTLTNQYKKY